MPQVAIHVPVLMKEAVEALAVKPGGRYVDCTLGAGGHSAAILDRSQPGGQLLGIEADPMAIREANKSLARFDGATLIVNDNFVNLESICIRHDFVPVNGVFFDLGMSSLQLGPEGRGFSFQYDAPLDMRFSPGRTATAAEILNSYPEEELAGLIYRYGGENNSRRIAKAIVGARPLETTVQLAGLIQSVSPGHHRIHPATKTFQALRIAVNQELVNLQSALEQSVRVLGAGGRLVVISYHSLEDRIVKNFFKKASSLCVCPPGLPVCACGQVPALKLVSSGAVMPSPAEIEANPRSRSARMRIAEKLAPVHVPGKPKQKGLKKPLKKIFDNSLNMN
jgi:16S rRNA (cytosine1402-N4)-methyltransferase